MGKLTNSYNLKKINPKLAKQWHPTKNGNLTPKDVTPSSNKKVWWICDKGHEWEANIYKRSHGSGVSLLFRSRLFAGITVYRRKILNYPRNGTQPKAEILPRRMLPLVAVKKFGGCAKKVMIGKQLLDAELMELDAPFA